MSCLLHNLKRDQIYNAHTKFRDMWLIFLNSTEGLENISKGVRDQRSAHKSSLTLGNTKVSL